MRQNRTIYLFNNTLSNFPSSKLPSNQQVLQRLLYYQTIEELKLKESAIETTKELIDIWKIANIPTKDANEIQKMIIKYYNEWNKLKMNEHLILNEKEYNKALADGNERTILKSINQQEKKELFKSNFNDLFDIGCKKAIEKMSIEEDIEFYLSQQKKNRPGYY